MMSPQNCRMRIAKTTAQVREGRHWFFTKGVLQHAAHLFQSVLLHLSDLLSDFGAQLWEVLTEAFVARLPEASSNSMNGCRFRRIEGSLQQILRLNLVCLGRSWFLRTSIPGG